MPPVRDDLHEPVTLGPHRVSGLWRVLLPEDAQWLRLPAEELADCSVCPPAARGEYSPGCRCCGYLPHVPNVLLGLALEDPEAGPRVRAAIADGHALPAGLMASPARFRRSIELDAKGGFGTQAAMACPFLQAETGGCGIYAYRNSTCSTFFCVNDHGAPGESLWDSMQALMGAAEGAVAQWAMGEAGLPWATQAERMGEVAKDLPRASSESEAWSEAARRLIWGAWYGREEAFYAACLVALRGARDGLFDRLAKATPTDAVAYEQAVRDSVAPEHQHEYPPIATDGIELRPVDDLWYRLQVRLRALWSLPLDGELVAWSPGIRIAPPSGRLPILLGGRHRVAGAERIQWLTDPELALLRRFRNGRVIDSDLLEGPEADALDDPRGFLAACLRRGVLRVT